jgi:poly(3-hydroxybutyrate) depolymerase
MLITSLALSFAAIGSTETSLPADQTPAPITRQDEANSLIRGIDGEVLGSTAQLEAALGGQLAAPLATAQSIRWVRPGVAEVQLGQTGTSWTESFLVGLPRNRNLYAPLLVLFHGYGQTPADVYAQTTYFQEARERGWFVVAPLGAHVYNYGIDYAQENTEHALDWVAHHLPIDDERVYGVGFSMGGGWMTSYAARHVAPDQLRFAGLVNHTGTTSLQDLYSIATENALFSSPLMFGGSPTDEPYRYCVASTMDWDSATGIVNSDTDIARNLATIPVWTTYADGDPLAHIRAQCDAFHDHYDNARGGDGLNDTVAGTTHHWSTVSETEVLDWLSNKTFTAPGTNAFNEILIDRDAKYWAFDVTQDVEGAVTPIRWYTHTGFNRVQIDTVSNMKEIAFDANEIGLNTNGEFSLVFNNIDGVTVDIVIRGLNYPPMNVTRSGSMAPSWTWDMATQELRLTEFNGNTFPLWTIQS